MTSPETPQFSDPIDRLNAEGRENILEEARRMREQIVESAFTATQEFLLLDAIQLQNLDKTYLSNIQARYFTGREYIFALGVSQDVICAETLLFEPNRERGQIGNHKLRTYIPVPSSFSVDKREEISSLPKPNFIIVERISEAGDSSYLAVNSEKCYEVEPRKSIEEIITPEFSDEELANVMSKIVDSGMKILTDIYEDMVNMKVVPQREFPAHN